MGKNVAVETFLVYSEESEYQKDLDNVGRISVSSGVESSLQSQSALKASSKIWSDDPSGTSAERNGTVCIIAPSVSAVHA